MTTVTGWEQVSKVPLCMEQVTTISNEKQLLLEEEEEEQSFEGGLNAACGPDTVVGVPFGVQAASSGSSWILYYCCWTSRRQRIDRFRGC